MSGSIISDVPTEFWVWGAVTLLMTAAIGFVAGVCYARATVKWTCRRARKQLSRLFSSVIGALETAQETCAFLEKFPNLLLTTEQIEKLDKTRNRLLDTVTAVVDTQRNAESKRQADAEQKKNKKKRAAEEFSVDWVLTPENAVTGLPDRSAFDANLQSMLEANRRSNAASGLLLVKVDKFAQLTSRFGAERAKQLMRSVIRVVLRAARDEDSICHYSGSTFGVFMPNVNDATGRRLAESIRQAVRHYRFRIDASGPEVLVTASFGYTTCLPDDNHELALDRAGNALAKSERRGRNQLHVHDGNTLANCLVN